MYGKISKEFLVLEGIFMHKNIKKIVSKLTVFSLAIGICFNSSFIFNANSSMASNTTPKYSFEKKSDGTIKITKYNGNSSIVQIPDTIAGNTVSEIGERAFELNRKITTIRFPKTLNTIDDFAFNECSRLESIDFPESLDSIGKAAFFGCTRIEELYIPYGTTKIGDEAFYGCVSLEKVSLNDTVTELGAYAFGMNEKLKEITLPDNIYELKDKTFMNCENLSMITLPANLKKIDEYAFQGCFELKEIDIPETVESIEENAFNTTGLTNISLNINKLPKKLFNTCVALNKVTLGNKVKLIDKDAFFSSRIKELEIGENVSSIEGSLTKTQVEKFTVSKDNKNFTTKDDSLYSKDMKKLIAFHAFPPKDDDEDDEEGDLEPIEVSVPDGVTTICENAFSSNEEVAKITLPDGLKAINDNAFSNNTALTKINLPDSLETIGKYAFNCCSLLEEIKIPDNVKVIEQEAFSECSSLNSFEFGKNTKQINQNAFREAFSDPATLTIGDNIESIDSTAFYNSSIAEFATNNNQSFEADNGILFSKDKKTIVQFPLCYKISSYTIPATVETLGEYSFANLHNDISFTFSEGLKNIKANAFLNTLEGQCLKLPSSISKIEDNAICYSSDESHKNVSAYTTLISDSETVKEYAIANDIALATDEPKQNLSEMTLAGNEVKRFSVSGIDTNRLYFSSSDKRIASVDNTGLVTGRKTGKTTIYATCANTTFACHVTVTSDGNRNITGFDDSEYFEFNEKNYNEWKSNYYEFNENASFNKKDNYSISTYSTNQYSSIVDALEGGKRFEDLQKENGKNQDSYKIIADNLKKELSQYKLSEGIHTYSGVSNVNAYTKTSSNFTDMMKSIGTKGTISNITSTTLDPSVANSFGDGTFITVVDMLIPKDGIIGGYIEDFSAYPNEVEFLLAQDFDFEIVEAGMRDSSPVAFYNSQYNDGNSDEPIAPEKYIKIKLLPKNKPGFATPTPSTKPSITPTTKPVTKKAKSSLLKKPGKVKGVKYSIKKKGKKYNLTVSWKKASSAFGYEIQKAKNKAFTKSKKNVTTSKKKYIFKNIKKRTVFLRVRAYNKLNKSKKYGQFSKVIKISSNKFKN